MNVESLCSAISQLPATENCLLTSSGAVSLTTLRKCAGIFAQNYRLGRGSRIALCGLSPTELIKAIIAFDGKVNAILLLPASMDEITSNELIKSACCTHRLNTLENEPIPILSKIYSDCIEKTNTTWLLATSGTTGKPKLIEHSLATLCRTIKRDPLRGAEFIWGLLYDPCRFAGIQVFLQALLSSSVLSVPDSMDFEAQVVALLKNRVNALSATPSLWRKLLMDGRVAELSLRQITLGGEIADQPILDALKHCFPDARIVHIYASTEAGSVFAINDGFAGFPISLLDGVNAPMPMRIREDGHLLVKPLLLPDGHEISCRIDADGYLDTQDLVKVQGNRVFFLGRASGAINVGGNKVNPEEVENIIREVDGVFDVRVYGKKSSMMGQIVAAEILPAKGIKTELLTKKIQFHCRQVLEKWQIPAFLFFVKEFKESAAGKKERLSI